MRKTLFSELMEAAGQALEHAKGKRDLRTTVLPDVPRAMSASDIRRMREQLHSSQAVFARFLNVSTQLVQAWESSRRRPDGAALRLLEVGRENPAVVFGGLTTNLTGRATRGTDVRKARRTRQASN
jgi:putative transcriptional regulator